jgi:putative ABC transport system permease protein
MVPTLANISLVQLAIALMPVALVCIIFFYWSLPTKRILHAIIRMLVQLLLVGYFLSYIFASDSAWIIGLLLMVMISVSSWIALNHLDGISFKLFAQAFIAIFASSFVVLLTVTQGVLQISPWYDAKTILPLAGMIFANAMNSVSLSAERFFTERQRNQPYNIARNTAFQTSMIPNINALFAVGIVSLPGMMTGQILSGVSPFIAARYQIMVMCMIFASAGLASALFLRFNKPH